MKPLNLVKKMIAIQKRNMSQNKITEYSLDAKLPEASLKIDLNERARRANVKLDAMDDEICPHDLLQLDLNEIMEKNEAHLNRKKIAVKEEVTGIKLVIRGYPVLPKTTGLNNVVYNYLPMLRYQNPKVKFNCVQEQTKDSYFVVQKYDGEEEVVQLNGEVSASKIIEKLERVLL